MENGPRQRGLPTVSGEPTPSNPRRAPIGDTPFFSSLPAFPCLQLFGGYGYMREYPIARAWVDARVQRIYGGTTEIMKEIVARDLLKG